MDHSSEDGQRASEDELRSPIPSGKDEVSEDEEPSGLSLASTDCTGTPSEQARSRSSSLESPKSHQAGAQRAATSPAILSAGQERPQTPSPPLSGLSFCSSSRKGPRTSPSKIMEKSERRRVQQFLQANGFSGVNDVQRKPRCPLKSSRCPLGVAEERGDVAMMTLLLHQGADPALLQRLRRGTGLSRRSSSASACCGAQADSIDIQVFAGPARWEQEYFARLRSDPLLA